MLSMIESSIGYVFGDKSLLHKAIHHSSLKKDGLIFERLEFLGDRVLGIIIADFLYRDSEKDNEGSLSRKFSSLVNAKACYQIALSIGLNNAIETANNKVLRDNITVLADGVEAIIGAVFIDGGFERVQKVVIKLWQNLLQYKSIDEPKTQLQEITQGKYGIIPDYTVISKTGPEHMPSFCVEVKVVEMRATGMGSSKKDAETEAAKAMIEILK